MGRSAAERGVLIEWLESGDPGRLAVEGLGRRAAEAAVDRGDQAIGERTKRKPQRHRDTERN